MRERSLYTHLRARYSDIDDVMLKSYCKKFDEIVDILQRGGIDIQQKQKIVLSSLSNKKQDDYISHACELALVHHFFSHFPRDFKYEVSNQVNSKNFDFSFKTEMTIFNVEVKTLCLAEPMEGKIIKYFGHPAFRKIVEKNPAFAKTWHTRLTGILEEASLQLPLKNSSEYINVVMICCEGIDDLTDVITCLSHSSSSIFVEKLQERLNIDVVVVCNIGYEHKRLLTGIMPKYTYMGLDDCVNTSNGDGSWNGSFVKDGKDAWNYRLSIPVLPMFVPINQKSLSSEQLLHIAQTFYTLNGYFYGERDNFQTAIFNFVNSQRYGSVT